MGMAKKRIFNSQSIFFCQLGVINKLFVFRAFQDKFFFGGGVGGEGRNLCSIFFPCIHFSLLSSFFTARFVAHFIVFPLCGVLAGYLFSGKGQRVAGK